MLSIYRLPNKLPGEKVIKILRRDFYILFKKVLFFLLLAAIFSVIVFLVDMYLSEAEGSDLYPIFFLAASALALFVWLFFFFSFIDYYLDIWIITNERIINIEQQGFFSRTISEQRLFRIQDVTSEVEGFFPTVLKFGNVYVQTAAEKERFSFEQIPDPNGVRDTIIKLAESERERLSHEAIKKEVNGA
jgi:signal transduction histidine kinase